MTGGDVRVRTRSVLKDGWLGAVVVLCPQPPPRLWRKLIAGKMTLGATWVPFLEPHGRIARSIIGVRRSGYWGRREERRGIDTAVVAAG